MLNILFSLLFLYSVIALSKFEEPFWYTVYIEDAMERKVVLPAD